MKLSQHDLQQLDDDALRRLPEAALRTLSSTLLADLKEARKRLQQSPTNSSRPPSSRAPWERGQPAAKGTAAAATPAPSTDTVAADAEGAPAVDAPTTAGGPAAGAPGADGGAQTPPKRTPGKQPGAPGVGRTHVFQAHATEVHRPPACAVCGQALADDAPSAVYTAFQSLDLKWGDPAAPGLYLWVVDHPYQVVTCPCGHHTRAQPARGAGDPTLAGVQVREWRLIGPGLATLIVALSLRFRLSRARIQEFLEAWLGVHLSPGHGVHFTSAVARDPPAWMPWNYTTALARRAAESAPD